MRNIIFRLHRLWQDLTDNSIYEMRPPGQQRDGFMEFLLFCRHKLPYPKVIVEVGSYAGESSVMIARVFPHTKVYCVDLWRGGYERRDRYTRPSLMPTVERAFDARRADYPNIKKIKSSSLAAASFFYSTPVDMIYIDGNHSSEFVRSDILTWRPKIRSGGILAGHDFDDAHRGVILAVFETMGRPHVQFPDSSWAFIV